MAIVGFLGGVLRGGIGSCLFSNHVCLNCDGDSGYGRWLCGVVCMREVWCDSGMVHVKGMRLEW